LDRWIPIDTSPFKRDYKRLRNTQIQQKVKNGIRGIVESDNPREQGEHKVNNLDCIYGYEIGLKYTASGPSSTHCYIISIYGLQEINESNKRSKYHHHKYNATSIKKEIKWIEILLQTPIDDYRKNTIRRILAAYLINIKNLTYEESYNIIK
jgi:hypothetical protein